MLRRALQVDHCIPSEGTEDVDHLAQATARCTPTRTYHQVRVHVQGYQTFYAVFGQRWIVGAAVPGLQHVHMESRHNKMGARMALPVCLRDLSCRAGQMRLTLRLTRDV